MTYVIGIDPDSEKHGVAVYENGKLIQLHMMDSVQIFNELVRGWMDVSFSIENVMANQFVYARNRHESKQAQNKIAMRTGRCQQAQVELMRWLDHYEIPYVLHRPQSGNWADKRELFQKITGWTGNSNPDTRAAAFFGFLALKK